MKLTVKQLARMLDLSAVRTEVDLAEVRRLAEVARQYHCVCTFVLPCYFPELKALLADAPEVGVGAVVGFPSGAHSTAIKVAEAREQLTAGAVELDMVINVGLLKGGKTDAVRDEIRAIKEAVGSKVLKVIIETCYLSGDEKVLACTLAVAAGADFVKTSTGFGTGGATFEDVQLMLNTVAGKAKVKASGGVRDAEMALKYVEMGVMRLGTSNGIAIVSGEKVTGAY